MGRESSLRQRSLSASQEPLPRHMVTCFISFRTLVRLVLLAPAPPAQAIVMPSSTTSNHVHASTGAELVSSSRHKRASEQVDLDEDDLNLLSKHSKLTITSKHGNKSIILSSSSVSCSASVAASAVPSCSSTGPLLSPPSVSSTIKRKYDTVAMCLKGHGLCPKRAWTIDTYCPSCNS